MFGYVQPYKPDLTFAEFAQYREIYCGLCKTIGSKHGQIFRLGLNYDLTFISIVILALTDFVGKINNEVCITHPFIKHNIYEENSVFRNVSDILILLMNYKLEDNINDADKKIISKILLSVITHNGVLNEEGYREARPIISEKLRQLHVLENDRSELACNPIEMGNLNGEIGEIIFRVLLERFSDDYWISEIVAKKDIFIELMLEFVNSLTKWVYYIDACDDFVKDKLAERPNPFIFCRDLESLWRVAKPLLVHEEMRLNNIAMKMPWQRYETIISNILKKGLPYRRFALENGIKIANV